MGFMVVSWSSASVIAFTPRVMRKPRACCVVCNVRCIGDTTTKSIWSARGKSFCNRSESVLHWMLRPSSVSGGSGVV